MLLSDNRKYPSIGGILYNFSPFLTEALAETKAEYGLNMPTSLLVDISYYYHKKMLRAPTGDEILFFDTIYTDAEGDISISDFITDNRDIMESFRDATEKYGVVYPNESGPVSLRRLSTLASDYLIGSGVPSLYTKEVYSEVGKSAPLLALSRNIEISEAETADGSISLALADCTKISAKNTTIRQGDYILVISAKDLEGFYVKAKMLMSMDAFIKNSVIATPVKDNIIITILNAAYGASFDLTQLPCTKDSPLSSLTSIKEGNLCVICRPYMANMLYKLSLDLSLDCSCIGSISKKKRLILNYNNNSIAFDSDFIRNIINCKDREKREVNTDYAISTSGCSLTSFVPHPTCNILKKEKRELISNGRVDVMLTSASHGTSPFYDAANAVVLSAAKAVAAGEELQSNSIMLRFLSSYSAEGKESISSALSALLGLYLSQIELCIPSPESRLVRGDINDTKILTVIPHKERSNNICGSVYYLKPNVNEGGLPDYENIRKLFSYINALQKNGKICYAVAVEGSVEKTLNSISAGNIHHLSNIPPEISGELVFGSFIVVSQEEIPGLMLGEILPTDAPYHNPPLLCNKTRVLLPIFDSTGDVAPFVKEVKRMGGECASLFMKNGGVQSPEILSLLSMSNILLLSADRSDVEQFISTYRTAISEFNMSGGLIVALNDASYITEEHYPIAIKYENGITKEELAALLCERG